MKLSAHDIKHQEFQNTLNGYSKSQVREFLAKVAESYDEKLEQLQKLRDEITRQDQMIEQLRISELELKRAVVSAERLHSDSKQQAEREAGLILREARAQADNTLRDADVQKEQILKSAQSLKFEAEKEVKDLRKDAIREADSHKRRAQQLADTLRKQVEFELNRQRQKAEQEALIITEKAKSDFQRLHHDMEQLRQEKQLFIEQFRAMLHVYGRNLDDLEKQLKQAKTIRPISNLDTADALKAAFEEHLPPLAPPPVPTHAKEEATAQNLAKTWPKFNETKDPQDTHVELIELQTLHEGIDDITQEALGYGRPHGKQDLDEEHFANPDPASSLFDYSKTRIADTPYHVKVLDTQEWFEEFASDQDIEDVESFEKRYR
ncbi:MAG: DivIVA domain-containing protein [Deinococcales bacterium]